MVNARIVQFVRDQIRLLFQALLNASQKMIMINACLVVVIGQSKLWSMESVPLAIFVPNQISVHNVFQNPTNWHVWTVHAIGINKFTYKVNVKIVEFVNHQT